MLRQGPLNILSQGEDGGSRKSAAISPRTASVFRHRPLTFPDRFAAAFKAKLPQSPSTGARLVNATL
jgi:hypothetical protein